jgi:hypothetical protein
MNYSGNGNSYYGIISGGVIFGKKKVKIVSPVNKTLPNNPNPRRHRLQGTSHTRRGIQRMINPLGSFGRGPRKVTSLRFGMTSRRK